MWKSVKKCFFLRKLTKISNLVNFFSEIPKMSICVGIRQGAFLSEEWKCYRSEAVSSLQFFASEMREREAYRKQMGSNMSVLLRKVSALEHDWFNQQKNVWEITMIEQIKWREETMIIRLGFLNQIERCIICSWYVHNAGLRRKKSDRGGVSLPPVPPLSTPFRGANICFRVKSENIIFLHVNNM